MKSRGIYNSLVFGPSNILYWLDGRKIGLLIFHLYHCLSRSLRERPPRRERLCPCRHLSRLGSREHHYERSFGVFSIHDKCRRRRGKCLSRVWRVEREETFSYDEKLPRLTHISITSSTQIYLKILINRIPEFRFENCFPRVSSGVFCGILYNKIYWKNVSPCMDNKMVPPVATCNKLRVKVRIFARGYSIFINILVK